MTGRRSLSATVRGIVYGATVCLGHLNRREGAPSMSSTKQNEAFHQRVSGNIVPSARKRKRRHNAWELVRHSTRSKAHLNSMSRPPPWLLICGSASAKRRHKAMPQIRLLSSSMRSRACSFS